MDSDVARRVTRVLAEMQKLDVSRITPESTFEELGIDSFDGVNILFAIENEFHIHVPDDDAKGLRSVGQMIDGVEKLVAARAAAGE
jgi:acyl carrier protein